MFVIDFLRGSFPYILKSSPAMNHFYLVTERSICLLKGSTISSWKFTTSKQLTIASIIKVPNHRLINIPLSTTMSTTSLHYKRMMNVIWINPHTVNTVRAEIKIFRTFIMCPLTFFSFLMVKSMTWFPYFPISIVFAWLYNWSHICKRKFNF